MNVLLLKRWLREEGPALGSVALHGVRQVDAKSVALRFDTADGGRRALLVSVLEDYPALAILREDAPELRAQTDQTGFVKALRHQLRGHTLIGIEQAGFDRSVVFSFSVDAAEQLQRTQHGSAPAIGPKQLRVELAGRASNVYIISERGMVVSMLKPIPPGSNRVRIIKTGKRLPPPPPLGKLIAAEHGGGALAAELESLADPGGIAQAVALRELLTRRVAGGEVKLWPALEGLVPVAYDLDTLYRFIAAFQAGEHDDQLFSLHAPGDANRVALDAWRTASSRGGAMLRLVPLLESKRRTVEQLESQLALAGRASELEDIGLTLLAEAEGLETDGTTSRRHLEELQRSAPAWASRIDLQATVRENAGRLISLAQRLRRGRSAIEQRLAASLADKAVGEERVKRTAAASEPAVSSRAPKPDALSARLERRGVKFLRFTSSDGVPILCGVSDASNDGLLREFGSAKHVWLHVRDFAGSHVILLSNGKDVPRRTLEEAAAVAAFHSKGKRENTVDVSYVPMKHVRKPKGAKPGLVLVSQEKVIAIRPAKFEEWRTHLLRAV